MTYSDAVEEGLQRWRDSLGDLLDILAGKPSGRSLDQLRDGYVEMLQLHPVLDGVEVAETTLGGVPTLQVRPPGEARGHLMYFHGGAYLFGAARGYLGLASRLAIAGQVVVHVPDYRLAPDHPYPTPILDCVDAYAGLLASGADPARTFFCGDSAGGALTVSVMVHARDRGWPLPAGGTAISPWCDLTHGGASMTTRHGIDPLCTKEALDLQAAAFLGGADPTSWDASPVHADLTGLPPILVQVGEAEVMMSGAVLLAERLAAAGVRTNLEVWPQMFHVWHLFASALPEAEQAIHSAVHFHDTLLDRTQAAIGAAASA